MNALGEFHLNKCELPLIKLVIVLLVLSVLQAKAVEEMFGRASNWQALLAHSPFGGETQTHAQVTEPALEYRGYTVEDGIYYFCLHDRAASRSFWLMLQETKNETTIRRYDEATGTLYAEHGGKMVTMLMRQARVALTSVPENIKTSEDSASAVAGEISKDESGRLQQVAGEIRRRRALRQAGKSTGVVHGELSP